MATKDPMSDDSETTDSTTTDSDTDAYTQPDLTGFQRDLIRTVAVLDSPHGLAIKADLEDYYETEIHHGRLYPNLDTLVDKGLVEKGQRDRRTNYYELTRRGRRETEAYRDWWVDGLED